MPESTRRAPSPERRIAQIRAVHGQEIAEAARLALARGDIHAKTLSLLALTNNPSTARRLLGE